MRIRLQSVGGLLLLGCVLWLIAAHAADAATWSKGTEGEYSFTLFDPVDGAVKSQAGNWFTSIQGIILTTFQILAVIEICWAAAIWAFEKDSLNSLAVEVIKKVMFIGFFFVLLQNAPTWIPTIVDSFEAVGTAATASDAPGGGGDVTITTDWFVARGLGYCKMVFDAAPGIT